MRYIHQGIKTLRNIKYINLAQLKGNILLDHDHINKRGRFKLQPKSIAAQSEIAIHYFSLNAMQDIASSLRHTTQDMFVYAAGYHACTVVILSRL